MVMVYNLWMYSELNTRKERKRQPHSHYCKVRLLSNLVISCNNSAFYGVWGSSPTGLMQYCTKWHQTAVSTQPNQLHKNVSNREKEKWGVKPGWQEDWPKTYRHFVSHQGIGVHDGDELVEEVGLGDEELRGQPFHHGLQLLGSVPWDSIPGLWLTPKIDCKSRSISKFTWNFSSFFNSYTKSTSKHQCKQDG